MKTLQEFQEAARRAGLKGKIFIRSRHGHLGFGFTELELSMNNGENDLMEAGEFGNHTIRVAHGPCPMYKANATYQGRGYFLKDMQGNA